jgi:plastocyanin
MRTRLAIAVAAMVIALVVAACGGDGSGGGGGGKSASASTAKAPVQLSGQVNNRGTKTATGGKIAVEADDYYFSPTFIKAKPGSTLTIEIKNEGTMLHSYTIDAAKVDALIPAGKKGQVTVTVPKSGNLNFYCKFHKGLGMQGAIVAS